MPGELVLLVDDEPSILQLARMYLERDGFRIQEAGDGEAALDDGHGQTDFLMLFPCNSAEGSVQSVYRITATPREPAIVHEIVAAHGGRISVRSALGRGTAFIVHLPLKGRTPG